LEKAKNFWDLIVWQKAHAMVIKVYEVTKHFPTEERFGLVPQMRRAAVSVAANIAEGFKRQGNKNKVQFYNMGQTSLEEVRYYLILARDLKYMDNTDELTDRGSEVARLLQGLVNSIKNFSEPRLLKIKND